MTTKRFVIHLLLLAAFILLVLFMIIQMMNKYTNHGQKLVLPDYLGQHIDIAHDDAEGKSFRIVVNDSIFQLGTLGGMILNQNPKPKSEVKENRKIYVTLARYGVEMLKSDVLPDFYGMSYEMRKKELAALDIDLIIKSYKYDKAEPNMILEAWYKGKLIDNSFGKRDGIDIAKGTSIEVVLSEKDNGETDLPDLRCNTLDIAKSQLAAYRLKLGEVITDGIDVAEMDHAYIYKQIPSPDIQSTIHFGSEIKVYLQKNKPENCQ